MNSQVSRLFSYLKHRLVDCNPRFRLFLLKLVLPDRDFDVYLFGSRVRVNARKEIGYANAYRASQGSALLRDESGVLVTLALLLEPADTFVDVGANVGVYSSVLARVRRVYPHLKLYAFEPNPDTVARLRDTLKGKDVEIFDCALSNHDGELEFCAGAGSCSFGVKHLSNPFQIHGPTQRINARRLDSVGIAGDSIVLKIDVEGHEREVVEGAAGLFAAERVKAVYMDGYEDKSLPQCLREMRFEFFDGRTLLPGVSDYSLLAIHCKHLDRWAHLGRKRPGVASYSLFVGARK